MLLVFRVWIHSINVKKCCSHTGHSSPMEVVRNLNEVGMGHDVFSYIDAFHWLCKDQMYPFNLMNFFLRLYGYNFLISIHWNCMLWFKFFLMLIHFWKYKGSYQEKMICYTNTLFTFKNTDVKFQDPAFFLLDYHVLLKMLIFLPPLTRVKDLNQYSNILIKWYMCICILS